MLIRCITERGQQILAEKPSKISVEYLGQFVEFTHFRQLRRDHSPQIGATEPGDGIPEDTPEETLQAAYQHGVGVTTEATYDVKRIDSDYFSDE